MALSLPLREPHDAGHDRPLPGEPMTLAALAVMVAIPGKLFSPAQVTVAPGESVMWRNGDFAVHDVRGPGFASPRMNRFGSFTQRFDTPGSYSYVCSLHPFMTGVVNVVAPPPPTRDAAGDAQGHAREHRPAAAREDRLPAALRARTLRVAQGRPRQARRARARHLQVRQGPHPRAASARRTAEASAQKRDGTSVRRSGRRRRSARATTTSLPTRNSRPACRRTGGASRPP